MSLLGDAVSFVGKAAGIAAAAAAVAGLTSSKPYDPKYAMSNQFPKDLNGSYYFYLRFYQYQRASLMEVGNALEQGSIRLPIPNNLSDTYTVTYGEEAAGTALGGGASALGGFIGGASFLDSMKEATASVAVDNVKKALGAPLGTAVGASLGVAANPFMTVLFKNPNYKEYSFSWRLYPRNAQESGMITNIVQQVRYNMLPSARSGSGGSLLDYPSLVRCSITAKGQELYPFKYGVIKNATFNYAPDGTPSFHTDGTPSAVDLKIDIQEVEYFLRDNLP
jgi:hypothetical protein